MDARKILMAGATALLAGFLLTGCNDSDGSDADEVDQVGTSVESDPIPPEVYVEPDTSAGDVEPVPVPPDVEYVDPETSEDGTVQAPYEPYVLPDEDPPGVERCLYAGDPLCDTTIEVPPPNLDGW